MSDIDPRRSDDVWYVVRGAGDVVAGPFSDPETAQRLAEGFGPDHVAVPGTMLGETEPQGTK
jgi:hypothetical protein